MGGLISRLVWYMRCEPARCPGGRQGAVRGWLIMGGLCRQQHRLKLQANQLHMDAFCSFLRSRVLAKVPSAHFTAGMSRGHGGVAASMPSAEFVVTSRATLNHTSVSRQAHCLSLAACVCSRLILFHISAACTACTALVLAHRQNYMV